MDITLFQWLQLALTVTTTLVAVAAFVRVGRWRNSDDAKTIVETLASLKRSVADIVSDVTTDDGGKIKADIHRIRNDLTKIEIRLGTAERASEKVSAIEGRLTGMETSLQHMASRSDIESVKSEIAGIEQLGRSTSAAVLRVETFLMERAG